jgi:lipopolysaccharide transport system permease protein
VKAGADHVQELRPPRGWEALEPRELWGAREILRFLIWRDLRVRYRQTALGATWALIQPIAAIAIFTVIFARLVGVSTGGVPYPVFALAGLLPWQFFAHGVTTGSMSLVFSEQLVRRVYFPRLVIPTGVVLAGGVDTMISTVMLLVLALAYGVAPSATWLLVPICLLLAVPPTLAAAIWLSALNVRYRDVQQMVPFLVQLLMFASPIVYPSAVLGEAWQRFYALNPIVGAIEAVRWAMFGGPPPVGAVALSLAVSSALLVAGAYYFRRTEQSFADVI